MVHNNKVLTVSYGTFSCTLEGFDDSFGTMKAIAEYFRDLASDDRYFGAEPPQPDAEMLARIAQKEITRQVEAHTTGTGGFVLRATDPEPAQVAIEAAPEMAPEPVAEPEAEVAETTEAPATVADTIGLDQAEPDVAEPVVAETAEPEPMADITQDNAIAEPEAADAVEMPEAADAAEMEAPAPVEVPSADEVAPEPDAAPATDTAEILEMEPAKAPPTVPAADSIAAKLQRIRAVVSQNDTLVQTDDYAEDEDPGEFASEAAQDIAQSLNAPDDADEDYDADLELADLQESDNEILQVLNQLDGAQVTEPVGDAPANDLPETQDQADDSAAVDDASGDDLPQDQPEDEIGDATALTDDVPADEPLTEDDTLDADDDVAGSRAEAEAAQPQAHVLKIKRADLESAIATGQLEQIDDAAEADADEKLADLDDTTLSPEDEADLLRELAEVEAELEEDGPEADEATDEAEDNIFGTDIVSEVADDLADQADQDAIASAALSQSLGDDDEADLARLMAEADEKLDDPAISSRHETYSQLRAAVASAEAERSAGGSIEGDKQDEAYRDDLADVVQPRRPALDANRPNRRIVESRPAPLKLVAEQRVDDEAGIAQRGPVRPRRVMTVPADDSLVSDATGTDSAFAEFAARMGATELPDLLEAAAAYLSFVEGHDKFSRPQLMNKVRLIQQDNFNREDGLRSFGQLLRDGKIEKRGGGRFAASVEIGFRPDEREAG